MLTGTHWGGAASLPPWHSSVVRAEIEQVCRFSSSGRLENQERVIMQRTERHLSKCQIKGFTSRVQRKRNIHHRVIRLITDSRLQRSEFSDTKPLIPTSSSLVHNCDFVIFISGCTVWALTIYKGEMEKVSVFDTIQKDLASISYQQHLTVCHYSLPRRYPLWPNGSRSCLVTRKSGVHQIVASESTFMPQKCLVSIPIRINIYLKQGQNLSTWLNSKYLSSTVNLATICWWNLTYETQQARLRSLTDIQRWQSHGAAQGGTAESCPVWRD